MSGLVLRTDRDGAATLTINRPDKLNALNVEVFIELDAHVKALAFGQQIQELPSNNLALSFELRVIQSKQNLAFRNGIAFSHIDAANNPAV